MAYTLIIENVVTFFLEHSVEPLSNQVMIIARIFNRALIGVLTHILLDFQFVCVAFGGRRRRPIAVER